MSAQSTALQALEAARAAKTSHSQAHYAAQVRQYQPAAEEAFRAVIMPWWGAFAASPEAVQIRLQITRSGRQRVAIADPVRYIDAHGVEWEATVMLEPARSRALLLRVGQLRGGRPVSSLGGAMLAHQMRRTIPVEAGQLGELDLHPIVIIDFAEQITTHVVAAYLALCLKE